MPLMILIHTKAGVFFFFKTSMAGLSVQIVLNIAVQQITF